MGIRTWRECVRVIIVKGNKVLLCNRIVKSNTRLYTFPGGGVEGRDTYPQTVRKEVMEEVGLAVKNIRPLGFTVQYEYANWDLDWRSLYKGSHDVFYLADYDKVARELDGTHPDEMDYNFYTFKEAIANLLTNKEEAKRDAYIHALKVARNKII